MKNKTAGLARSSPPGDDLNKGRISLSGQTPYGRPRIPMLREKILRSAALLFAARGFDEVSIDEIAARAGVGKGSVYRQFASKEELYSAIVIEGYRDLRLGIAAELRDERSARERLTIIVRQIVAYFWEKQNFFELLRDPEKVPRSYEVQYRTERQKLIAIASEVIVRGARDGSLRDDLDPSLLVESLLGMIRAIQRSRDGSRLFSQEEVVRTVVDLFLQGCARLARA